jgi:hypothetical protein
VAQLGFLMDGVLTVRNLTGIQGLDAVLRYYANPVVFNFSEPDNTKVFKGEMLIIEVSFWDCFFILFFLFCCFFIENFFYRESLFEA